MPNLVRTTAAAASVAAAGLLASSEPVAAQPYPIDCAILLCLSGGWPASTPCALARAEFIRRVTPWPIEPPLQIWRCPMGASVEARPEALPGDRVWDALLEESDAPLQSRPAPPLAYAGDGGGATPQPQPAVLRHESGGAASPLPDGFALRLVQEDYINEEGSADIDISGAAFDFVRSIRVFHVRASQSQTNRDGECVRTDDTRLGTYGAQGDYRWSPSRIEALPPGFADGTHYGAVTCPAAYLRSVFIDWRDHQGNCGWEQVNY